MGTSTTMSELAGPLATLKLRVAPFRSRPPRPLVLLIWFGPVLMAFGGVLSLSDRRLRVGVLQGRLHTYEGWSAAETAFPVRLLVTLGARVVVLTNASGGVREGLAAGDWMVITDHLNLSGKNPLEGPNDPRVGPRFPDLSQAYYPQLRAILHRAAHGAGVPLHEGVYAMMAGPSYETPAEIRMLRTLGADAVGMSTVPEVIAAAHMGARVACLSCVTNAAAGLGGALSHAEVEATAQRAEESGVRILRAFLGMLAGSSGPG